tara:strand:- start:572 stop:1267 length:696 start_codon:yes stop_codon:yes gene_type:complete
MGLNILFLSIITTVLHNTLPAVNMPKLLFFSGGNSLMPKDIYTDFLSKLKKNYDVSIIKNSNNNLDVMEQIYDNINENSNIIPIGHSSGCTTLINYCSKFKKIDKYILLDPVDNNLKIENLNYKNILQINADKSYQWKFTPLPKVPFVPLFKMDLSKFNENNITKVLIKDYGHCDILDTAFSNLMHNTVAEGNENRESLDQYKNYLVYLIDSYINNNKLDNKNYEDLNVEF